ncbi:uncharacterized protein LOC130140127 isoform X2 [Syzygium oleosum]|uniref:uncharacterized protein LOC130140127 isoform X2 n=1 Tax=Syzygium oleosum TaxID=219896 RepID=UPI0024BB7C41|nr:uncharacterized protein LOC130140127 isoform X2 [Syzygium oleosum]
MERTARTAGPRRARRSVVDRRVLGGVRAELEGFEGGSRGDWDGGEADGRLRRGRQRSDREDRVLQAFDKQVVGACRADERLKPLLKSSGSSSAAKDRLLAHLSRHFEPAEVGILARCFCMPLVSIRVGKIDKQRTLLCPTSTSSLLVGIFLDTYGYRY